MKHVEHYCHGGEETIDKIKRLLTTEQYVGFCLGNIIKYRDRAPYKGDEEGDLEKMNTYCDYLSEALREESEEKTSEDVQNDNLGFTYPPLKNKVNVVAQLHKIQEELDELMEAYHLWSLTNKAAVLLAIMTDDEDTVEDSAFATSKAATSLLIESEDVIHAIEELQRVVMDELWVEDELQNEIKSDVQTIVFDKNNERGYYDIA